MARQAFSVAITSTDRGLSGVGDARNCEDPLNTVSTAAVAAAIAVLVADGASPTQGHVDTLAAAWATLLAGTGGIPARSDVVLSYDRTAAGNLSCLHAAIRKLIEASDGCGLPN